MDNLASIPISSLEEKRKKIISEISDLENKVEQLRREQESVDYVLRNFSTQIKFPQIEHSFSTSGLTKKQIIEKLLREEKYPMTTKQIYKELIKIRNTVGRSNFNSTMSEIVKDKNSNIKRIGTGIFEYKNS